MVTGDQAAHLMWRLQHGQLYVHSQPRLIVVMIGTNDLGAASCLGGASGIRKSAKGAAERSGTGFHHDCLQAATGSMHSFFWPDGASFHQPSTSGHSCRKQ